MVKTAEKAVAEEFQKVAEVSVCNCFATGFATGLKARNIRVSGEIVAKVAKK